MIRCAIAARSRAGLGACLAALLGGPACGVCLSSPLKWSQGQPAKRLAPSGVSVCVLTRVSGHFEGGGEWIRVHWEDGWWWLAGGSKQSGVSATAQCIRRSCFKGEKGGASLVSTEFQLKNLTAPSYPAISGCDCGEQSADTWPAGAATILTGLGGQFEGGAEWLRAEQSTTAGGASKLKSHTCQCGELSAYAHAFSVGKPGAGQLARFIGPDGAGSASLAGEYLKKSGEGAKSVEMAFTSQALCYFTQIGGDFRGGGEFVEIYRAKNAQGKEAWFLTAQHLSGPGVFARARCLDLVQPGAGS